LKLTLGKFSGRIKPIISKMAGILKLKINLRYISELKPFHTGAQTFGNFLQGRT